MKQRKQYEKIINCRLAAIGISILFAAFLLIFGKIYVNAAPAALVSPSSVVYETADENSNAVGNLVQGNTFELSGSITTEDGETWHLILMSNGVQGYMKGEVTTDIGNTPPAEENDEDTEGDEETEPETEEASTEEGSTQESLPISSNTQEKTYSIKADADRIRAQIQSSEAIQDSEVQKGGLRIDKTLVLLLFIMLVSGALLYFSYKKLAQMLYLSSRHGEASGKLWIGHGKAKKRKKVKKTKRKRIAKEAKKWKNNSLQK